MSRRRTSWLWRWVRFPPCFLCYLRVCNDPCGNSEEDEGLEFHIGRCDIKLFLFCAMWMKSRRRQRSSFIHKDIFIFLFIIAFQPVLTDTSCTPWDMHPAICQVKSCHSSEGHYTASIWLFAKVCEEAKCSCPASTPDPSFLSGKFSSLDSQSRPGERSVKA